MSKPTIVCKWPAFVVVGDRISPEQAAEILIRTSRWPLSSNAHGWDKRFHEIAEIPYNLDYRDAIHKARERLGVLNLYYLKNSHLTSCWYGGAYGWCNWDGVIATSDYNIGKWPSVEGVTKEWEKIAKAFPFLRLRAQVFSGETGDADIYPTAEWIVESGKVTCQLPTATDFVPTEREDPSVDIFNDNYGVGAVEEQVKLGVALALKHDPFLIDYDSE